MNRLKKSTQTYARKIAIFQIQDEDIKISTILHFGGDADFGANFLYFCLFWELSCDLLFPFTFYSALTKWAWNKIRAKREPFAAALPTFRHYKSCKLFLEVQYVKECDARKGTARPLKKRLKGASSSRHQAGIWPLRPLAGLEKLVKSWEGLTKAC